MANELDSLVAQFAAGHGIEAPQRDDGSVYHFVIDDDFEVALFQHGDQILIEAGLGRVPADRGDAGQRLALSLRRHLGRLRDHPEILSLDSDTDELVLFRRLAAQSTRAADLDRAVGDFANSLEFWQQASRASSRRPPPPPRQQVFRP